MLGIIALLIAILLPTLAGVRRRARRLACASQMRELGRAVQLYREEEQTLPFFAFGFSPAPLLERASAEQVLKPYIHDATMIRCPSDNLAPAPGFEWLSSSYVYWPGELMNYDFAAHRDETPRWIVKDRSNKVFQAPFSAIFTETEARHDGGYNQVMAPDWHLAFED